MPENRSMSIWEQIALVQQWAPMIGYGQQILAEKDNYKRQCWLAMPWSGLPQSLPQKLTTTWSR